MTEIPHLRSTLHSKYVGFLKKLEDSKKSNLKMLFNLLKDDKTSNTGHNIDFLSQKYDVLCTNDLYENQNRIKYKRVYELPQEEDWKPKILEELALMKLGLLESHLAEDEIDFLLEEIGTT